MTRLSKDHTLVILGATEQGLLSRLASGTRVLNIVEDLDMPVILAGRAVQRPLLEWLFG